LGSHSEENFAEEMKAKEDRRYGRSSFIMNEELLFVAGLAAGRDAFSFVAIFAQLVSGIFKFRCLGAVMTGVAGAGFDTIVMAFGAIADSVLVGLVREGDIAHAGRQFDFCRTIVSRNQGGGAKGNKADSDQDGKNAFHVDLLLDMVGRCFWQARPARNLLPQFILG
jgi:hypothetical protein